MSVSLGPTHPYLSFIEKEFTKLRKQCCWFNKIIITRLKESFAFAIDKKLSGQCFLEGFLKGNCVSKISLLDFSRKARRHGESKLVFIKTTF